MLIINSISIFIFVFRKLRMKTINLYNPKKLVFGQGSFDQALKDYASQQIERIFILTIQPVLEIISDKLEDFSSKKEAYLKTWYLM